MAAQPVLMVPYDVPLRLAVIEGLTGVPESTLREACLDEKIEGVKLNGKWHCSLDAYKAWVSTEGQGRGKLDKAPKRQVADRPGQIGSEADRKRGHQSGSTVKAPKKARRRRGRIPVVFEISPDMVRNPQTVDQPNDSTNLRHLD